jgi:TetR/AcrR family transcriptional regulator
MQIEKKLSNGATKILNSAEKLFAEDGFDAVTVEAIANDAEVSQANVIYHFKSKRGLYLAALRSVRLRISEKLDEISDVSDNLEQFLENLGEAQMQILTDDRIATRLFFRELLGYGILKSGELAEKVMGKSYERILKRLTDFQIEGRMKHQADPAVTALTLFATNTMFLQTREVLETMLGDDYKVSPDAYGHNAVEILLRGILTK